MTNGWSVRIEMKLNCARVLSWYWDALTDGGRMNTSSNFDHKNWKIMNSETTKVTNVNAQDKTYPFENIKRPESRATAWRFQTKCAVALRHLARRLVKPMMHCKFCTQKMLQSIRFKKCSVVSIRLFSSGTRHVVADFKNVIIYGITLSTCHCFDVHFCSNLDKKC